MTQRYQLLRDVYMNLNGQPQIVLCGTVFDAHDADGVHPSTATKLAESPTTTPSAAKPVAIRNVRTR